MFARPKPGDSEDDILAMQTAFLAEREKNKDLEPAAKVINMRKHKIGEPTPGEPKVSKYAQAKGLKGRNVRFNESHAVIADVIEKETEGNSTHALIEDDNVYYPKVLGSVLGNIVEKNVDEHTMRKPSPCNSAGFPDVIKRDKTIVSGAKSIFAQQMTSKNKMQPVAGPSRVKAEESIDSTQSTSAILKGDYAKDIHQQNKALLDNTPVEEILEMKEKLASTLDANLLEYIRSLRVKREADAIKTEVPPMECEEEINAPSTSRTEPEIEPENAHVADSNVLDVDIGVADIDVMNDPNLHNWVHFDTLEQDKLKWIKYMEEAQYQGTVDEPYEARFNFKGYLLPYSIHFNERTKTLFHHGEEPHRPGYTMTELFRLSRSTVTQQRSLAVSTIAGVLEYYSINIYNGIITIPITKIYFVLRFALDENISIILEPTLKALRNLFYNRIDEACLDFLLGSDRGLVQPRLISTKSITEETDSDVSELKDFHLVDLDLVSGALRTDLLPRIRYILSILKPNSNCVEYCLQILIRVARDSPQNAEALFKVDGLLAYICSTFIPKFIIDLKLFSNDSERHKQIYNALKLVRILVCQSKSTVEYFYKHCAIFQSLMNYLAINPDSVLLLKIQIETFYLWSCFLFYGYGLNELVEFKGILLKILDKHANETDLLGNVPVIMHLHATALITLLTNAVISMSRPSQPFHNNITKEFDYFVTLGLLKWITELCSITSYTTGNLNCVSAALLFLEASLKHGNGTSNNINAIDISIHKFLKSSGFDKMSEVTVHSNLLSHIKVRSNQNDSSIPNLNGSMVDRVQNLPPTLSVTSPIIFITSLSKYIMAYNNCELASQIVLHPNIYSYITKVVTETKLRLTDNWFSKIEFDMLCNILYLSTTIRFTDLVKEVIYNLAFKLTYMLSPVHKTQLEFILRNIVFNKEWFTTERLIRNLNLSESNQLLNNLYKILKCYITTLKLDRPDESSCLFVDSWNSTILPRDWMFMPILGLYSKIQERETFKIPKVLTKALEDQTKDIVICCLEWILVSELYFPEVTAEIGLTDRFCRLSCVFLCDNSLFLDQTVKPLMQRCMKIIFDIENSTTENKLDFNKPLLGINNFQDLYTQLVDQFQAVSYGDPSFSACILVPLCHKHDIKWRKLVWSEYAACLRALDCPEDFLCYPIDDYLQPAELDFSLLKAYHRALMNNQVRPNTIAHRIAHHHVEVAKFRQRVKRRYENSNSENNSA